MLTHIHIKNLVIVSELELEFDFGMTVLTGETGAGKSILIDALALTLGDKADTGLVRAGAERAEVSAIFDLERQPEALAQLAAQGIEPEESCVLRRVISREGRGKSYINGRPATKAQLQAVGELLVDIHGQHAHQSLLRRDAQRRLLDVYAGLEGDAAAVAEHYRQLRRLQEEQQALLQAGREREQRLELLRFQVEEFRNLDLQSGELEQLDGDLTRLANADELRSVSQRLVSELYEADLSVNQVLADAVNELRRLEDLDPRLRESRELLDGAVIQLEEAVGNLRGYADTIDADPAQLAAVEDRLGRIHDLARKLRLRPEDLPEQWRLLEEELAELEGAGERGDRLAAALVRAREDFLQRGRALSQARQTAAAQLEVTVTTTIRELGMTGGRFAVSLEPLEVDQAGPGGLERVEFLISGNPGQPLAPLGKVASGGELSRISLAINVATNEHATIPVMIFDEVDVGIGGRTAEVVGKLLRQLGRRRQVLCVTHLPQVAAQGHRHLQVSKHTDGTTTETRIIPLQQRSRVEEIARMLGGAEITANTLANAEEMIQRAAGGDPA